MQKATNLILYKDNSLKNPQFKEYCEKLRQRRADIRMIKFHKEHIMYFYITDYKDPSDADRVICKIGYSQNVTGRKKELESIYKCKFDLIGIKKIKGQIEEKEFHQLLKAFYPDLYPCIKRHGKELTELYILDKCIIEEFDLIEEYNHKSPVYNIPANEIKNNLVNEKVIYVNTTIDNNSTIITKNDIIEEFDVIEEFDLIEEYNHKSPVYNICSNEINKTKCIKDKLVQEEVIYKDDIQNIEWPIFYKFFDECFEKERFNTYDSWVNVGMAIKNKYGDSGFELFKYFSDKGNNPDPTNILLNKYNTFQYDLNKPITIKTIFYYAKEDNKDKFIQLIKTCSPFKDFKLTSVDIVKYIKLLKPNHFVWKDDSLYCFNGKYWENNDLPMRIYISNELFDFLQDIMITCFWSNDNKTFEYMKRSLDKLKSLNFKKKIVETTREYMTNNKIDFDTNYHLFGFENKVYDLKKGEFRDYKYDDFISIITGYDWEEPLEDEIKQVNDLINSIFRIKDEKQLYLEILATGLEGRCLEKFVIFNGSGGNGKGLMNDLFLLALGNYGFIANCSILFEKNKTGSNPEKANLHKKRFVVYREPSKGLKLVNSVIRELTGGGKFSARGHYETKTEKKLHATSILECNKKPLFQDDPEDADIRRLIDMIFRNNFTDNKDNVDEENNIYLADSKYKNENFQDKHKRALLKILFEIYKDYMSRNFTFNIPKSIKERTNSYLEMSCNILGWVNEGYEKTLNKKDFIKLKEMFHCFTESTYYFNLSKSDKRIYNYSYFVKQFSENVFFSKYYRERVKINGVDLTNILTNYKIKFEEQINDEENPKDATDNFRDDAV
jgi:phage/plasmid-associated DNA primase